MLFCLQSEKRVDRDGDAGETEGSNVGDSEGFLFTLVTVYSTDILQSAMLPVDERVNTLRTQGISSIRFSEMRLQYTVMILLRKQGCYSSKQQQQTAM